MSTLKVTNITPQSGSTVHLTGSLEVSETIIAKVLRTELTQSVVLQQSGSTQFGDTADDTHQFTGSVRVNGSITGSLLSSNGILSSSAQISTDISESLGSNATLIRSLTAVGITGSSTTLSSSLAGRLTTAESELGNTLLSSSAQIADDISGSLGTNATLIRSLTAAGITGSSTSLSSSLAGRVAANEAFSSSLDSVYATDAQVLTQTASLSSSLATDIATRALTANISGSFTSTSSSIATDIATNVTDISTLTAATGSYALSANVVANANTASFASTGSNTFTGNQILSASVLLTLQQFTGSAPAAPATGPCVATGRVAQLRCYRSQSCWPRCYLPRCCWWRCVATGRVATGRIALLQHGIVAPGRNALRPIGYIITLYWLIGPVSLCTRVRAQVVTGCWAKVSSSSSICLVIYQAGHRGNVSHIGKSVQ